MNQLPVLEYKGQMFCQTHAIEFYLAKKFKLLGNSAEDEYNILFIQGIMNKLITDLKPIIFPSDEDEKRLQIENFLSFIDENFEFYLKQLEKLLLNSINNQISDNHNSQNLNDENCKDLNNLYFLGNKLTLADFLVGIYIFNLTSHPLRKNVLESILKKNAPNLENLIMKLVNNDFSYYFANYHSYKSVI